MKRRTLVAGAAVGAAAAAGGTAFWRLRSGEIDGEESAIDVWTLSFATPDGPPLQMASLRGRPLLLNFWATWCAPCVTEMPILDAFAGRRGSATYNVLALAIDSVEPVRRFLGERSLRLPVALAKAEGIDLSRALGNTVGALPFTVMFDSAGQAVRRKLGPVDAALLDSWAATTR